MTADVPQAAPREPGRPLEAVAAWLPFAAAALAILVTYSRVPPSELYHVGGEGVAAGLGRLLVFLNYPVALVAVPFAAVAAAVLRRPAALAALLPVLASAALVPIVVDQSDLDARPANALPLAGVAVALALCVLAVRRHVPLSVRARLPGDRLRLALAVVLLVVAVPWLFAALGLYAPDPILADEPSPDEPLAAVHLGHHHGFDGVLLALAALALSRVPPRLVRSRLVPVASLCVAAMLVYGLGLAAEDAWLEQVVKRGTTAHRIPTITRPDLAETAVLFLAAVLVELAWFRRERRATRAALGLDQREPAKRERRSVSRA